MEQISTAELVAELAKRKGVVEMVIAPHEPYFIGENRNAINDFGPARILVIID